MSSGYSSARRYLMARASAKSSPRYFAQKSQNGHGVGVSGFEWKVAARSENFSQTGNISIKNASLK